MGQVVSRERGTPVMDAGATKLAQSLLGFLFSLRFSKSHLTLRGSPPLQSSQGYWSRCFSPAVVYWSRCSTPTSHRASPSPTKKSLGLALFRRWENESKEHGCYQHSLRFVNIQILQLPNAEMINYMTSSSPLLLSILELRGTQSL